MRPVGWLIVPDNHIGYPKNVETDTGEGDSAVSTQLPILC